MTRLSFSTLTLGAFTIVAFACASSQTTRVTESSPDVITSIEINATPVPTAFDIVSRLRPNWLRAGRTGSIGGGSVSSLVILVYLDGQRLGGIDMLKTLTAAGITSMRYLDATRAATILHDPGSEAISGAIVISTK